MGTVDFSLTQTGVHQPVDALDRAPPPEGFEKYEKKLSDPKEMLQSILTRLDGMTWDIKRAEGEAQMVYEQFLKATNKDLIAKSERLVDEKASLAKAEKRLAEHEEICPRKTSCSNNSRNWVTICTPVVTLCSKISIFD